MNEETQNNLDQSQEENDLDSLIGEESQAETTETETPDESAKIAKKAEDFEKAYRKEREEVKRLKAQLNAPVQPQFQPQVTNNDEEEAKKLLKSIVGEAIDEREKTREAVNEIKTKPYFDVLQPKILEAYREMPSDLSEADKLDRAYKEAVAQNLDLITQTALQVGQEAGFKNRSFKAAQGTTKPVPRSQANQDDWAERYKRGESTLEEDLEHADEIQQLEKEELGI